MNLTIDLGSNTMRLTMAGFCVSMDSFNQEEGVFSVDSIAEH